MEHSRPRATGRPAPAQHTTAAHAAPAAAPVDHAQFTPRPAPARRKPKRTKLLMYIVGGLVALGLLGLLAWLFMGKGAGGNTAAYIDNSKYQAVFFTNGQVYFGKLKPLDNGYMKLTEVFYIQAGQPNSENPQQTKQNQNENSMQLIKLGNEIHGPTDEMIISRDQVLFFENLKQDGKVSKGIEEYRKTQKN